MCALTWCVRVCNPGAASSAGAIALVRDGEPVAEIVLAEAALQGVRLAAEDLQTHLTLIAGATLPIVSEPTPGVAARVFVGTNAFTEALGFKPATFHNSGFEIVARDAYVILAGVDTQRSPSGYLGPEGLKRWHALTGETFNYGRGGEGTGAFNRELGIWTNDDTGTWYAVAELLEQLGVRWYMPYEDGTVIPNLKTVTVAEQHLIREAAFARREWCYYNAMRVDGEGIAWLKRLKQGNHTIIVYNHLTDDIFGPQIQKDKHPEFLARAADGNPYGGYPDGHGMPRYTDPGFRRAAALYMNMRFKVMPELTAISMGPPDGGIRMDARDKDLYGGPDDSIEQKRSNYVWDFHVFLANELKKAHPGKLLLYNSGAGARMIPTNIDAVPDNLIVPFAQPSSAFRVLEDVNTRELDRRRAWHAVVPPRHKAPIWDYYLYYRTPNNPRYPAVFTESLQREMQEMQSYADGKFIEIQPGRWEVDGHPVWRLNTPGLIHLMVYWQSRLFWVPDTDREALLAEYYHLFFGPASATMREFYAMAEAVWTRQESRSVTRTSGFMRQPDVNRFFALLAAAREQAGTGSVYDRRIARIEAEMQPLKKQFAAFNRTGPNFHVFTPKRSGIDFELDGDLNKPFWRRHRFWDWYRMRDAVTGIAPEKNRTEVSFRIVDSPRALIVGVIAYESDMENLTASVSGRDNRAIFNDDHVDILLVSAERAHFRIVVNPLGAVWEESHDPYIVDRDTLPELWSPGVKAEARREADRWTLELMIPADDFGTLGPSGNYRWGINVARNRRAGGESERFAIAPTGAADVSDLSTLGDLARGDIYRERLQDLVEPVGFPARVAQARALETAEDHAAAQAAFAAMVEDAPTAASRAFCRSRTALTLGRLGDLEHALDRANAIEPASMAALTQMAVLSEAREFDRLAAQFGDTDIATWPAAIDYRGFSLRAEAFAHTGNRTAAASDFLQSALRAGSDRQAGVEAFSRAAGLFRALQEADQAMAAYRHAIAIFDAEPHARSAARWRFPQILLGTAAIQHERGDHAAAMATLARYGDPDDPGRGDWWCQILEAYGDAYVALGRITEALTRYTQALETGAQATFINRVQTKIDAVQKTP